MKKIEYNSEFKKDEIRNILGSSNLNFMLGSGASHPCINILGDLEKVIQEQLKNGTNNFEELNDYFDWFNNHVSKLIDIESNVVEHKEHLDKIKEYEELLKIIIKILVNRNLDSQKANIYTTNYDLFIEKAASNLIDITFNDGFNRSSSLRHNYKFDTRNFFKSQYYNLPNGRSMKHIPQINLIKIHGSLNWKMTDNAIQNDINLERIPEIKSLDEINKINKAIVLPLKEKFIKTLIDNTYYDLLRIFSSTLEQPNSLLFTFGFSFKDEHILEIAKRSLLNPSLAFILIAHKDDDLTLFEKYFSEFENVTCIHPKKGNKIKFKDLIDILDVI